MLYEDVGRVIRRSYEETASVEFNLNTLHGNRSAYVARKVKGHGHREYACLWDWL